MCYPPCFNPALGFLFASTQRQRRAGSRRRYEEPGQRRFNPALGFLFASTRLRVSDTFMIVSVSIPLWVFSLLRPIRMTLPTPRPNWFQSRSGFSLCFDRRVVTRIDDENERFNPALGFLFASTARSGPPPVGHDVSIPLWVFSLLRRPKSTRIATATTRFNPALGFLFASTLEPNPKVAARINRFNPALGFLFASTGGEYTTIASINVSPQPISRWQFVECGRTAN